MSKAYLVITSYKVLDTDQNVHDFGETHEMEVDYQIDFFSQKEFNNFNFTLDNFKEFFLKEVTDVFGAEPFSEMIWNNLSIADAGLPIALAREFGEHFTENKIILKEHQEGFFYGSRLKDDGSEFAEDLTYETVNMNGNYTLYAEDEEGYIYTYFGVIVDSDEKAVINRLKKSFTRDKA